MNGITIKRPIANLKNMLHFYMGYRLQIVFSLFIRPKSTIRAGNTATGYGKYNPLNARIGIPIVLINKQAEPAINFEFQVRVFDITGKIDADRLTTGKTSIGVSIGIPLCRIAY